MFSQCESSPLNVSQQYAVLLNDDHNLVLAGAGSGKTSVLTARVPIYCRAIWRNQSKFVGRFCTRCGTRDGRALKKQIGLEAERLHINTFHQLGLRIINRVEGKTVIMSPLANDSKLKQAWCIDWLKRHWMTPTNFKRWQKHLAKWPIAYLAGDDELGSHVETRN